MEPMDEKKPDKPSPEGDLLYADLFAEDEPEGPPSPSSVDVMRKVPQLPRLPRGKRTTKKP